MLFWALKEFDPTGACPRAEATTVSRFENPSAFSTDVTCLVANKWLIKSIDAELNPQLPADLWDSIRSLMDKAPESCKELKIAGKQSGKFSVTQLLHRTQELSEFKSYWFFCKWCAKTADGTPLLILRRLASGSVWSRASSSSLPWIRTQPPTQINWQTFVVKSTYN